MGLILEAETRHFRSSSNHQQCNGLTTDCVQVREGHDISTDDRTTGSVQKGIIRGGHGSVGNSFTEGSQVDGLQRVVRFLKP